MLEAIDKLLSRYWRCNLRHLHFGRQSATADLDLMRCVSSPPPSTINTGHFWEARYYATAIAPKDHRRVLNTLRYIHANPKAAGVRQGVYDPYSNYGHYGRLACDGISEWHPSFLQLESSLKGCSRRYERFCQKYGHHAKGGAKCHWGSRMLKRLVGSSRSKKKRVSPGQQQLPFVFDVRLNQIPEEWYQVAVRFRRANGIRDGDRERRFWQLR